MTYYDDEGKEIEIGCSILYTFDNYEFCGTIAKVNDSTQVVFPNGQMISLESVVSNYDSVKVL